MASQYKEKCLVCLKTGGNLNIFTTYNISGEKEELYVDVIKNCFDIEITLDSGLHAMCHGCGLKLRKAYHFRKCIIEAVNKLIFAKVSETSENISQHSDIEYIDNIPFDNIYDVDMVLNTESEEISYNFDKANDHENIDYSNSCAFGLDNNDEDKNETEVKEVEDNKKQSATKENRADLWLTPEQTALTHFTLENTNEDEAHNPINYFMDLSNILGIDTLQNESGIVEVIQDIENKDQAGILISQDESNYLNILHDNTLKSFLFNENDIRVLEIDNNSGKHIVAKDDTEKLETLNPDTSHRPFVLSSEIDEKTSCINVTNIVVADVDKVSKASKCKKIVKKIIRMRGKKTNDVVEKSTVVDTVNIESKVNPSIAAEENKEKDQSIKKTVKRKYEAVLNHESGLLVYTLHNDNEKYNSDCTIDVDNDLPEKKVVKKRNRSKKTVKKDGQENDQASMDVDNDLPKKKEAKKSTRGKKPVKKNAHENDQSSTSIDNDLPEEKAVKRSKKSKTAIEKDVQNTDSDMVKENVPSKVEDVKPKKKRESKEDPIDQFNIMPGQTECTVCKAQFETTILLREHMRTHPPQYICAVCGVKWDNRLKYNVHMRSHQEGPFYCKFCKKEFSKINTRNTHEWRVHSKPEPFKCAHCGERFKTYLRRLRHAQREHGATPEYPCTECGKTFAYAAYRLKHIRIAHEGSRPYECLECPAAFARRRALASHRASKHGDGERAHRCELCGRRFYERSALRWHVAHTRHAPAGGYPCNHCDQRFDREADLEAHARAPCALAPKTQHPDIPMGLDLMTSLPLGELDEYDLMSSVYMDLNEI